ncbi:MAG: formylglycine-generating enzyme family protein [Planctomycetota bacterium]
MAFCEELSEKEGSSYRLPTEAEWEYACRGGTRSVYSFGDDDSGLGDYAWFRNNTYDVDEKHAHVVGQKKPNPWGLYDMHGNVWERCSDRYDKEYYSGSPGSDPTGPASGSDRVSRGGGWLRPAGYCRSASRSRSRPSGGSTSLGFRVAFSPAAAAGK